MRRRRLLVLIGAMLVWPLSVRAQDRSAPYQPVPDPPDPAQQNDDEVGQVATLTGAATVTRANAAPAALSISDAIYRNDIIQTGVNASLGITFDDETTLSLTANTRITINEFVYEEGGSGNQALFNVARGTLAFVGSKVAKTGDMKISTPSATLGIRGTTGVVDVPASAIAGAGDAKIKLYPDADGRTGQIEVFSPQGGRLGALTQGASAFAIRLGPGGRFAAVPFQIPPQEASRDRGVVQRLFASHNSGRQMTIRRLQSRGPRPQRSNPRSNNQRPNNQRPDNPRTNPQPNNRPGNPRQGSAAPRQNRNGTPQQGGNPVEPPRRGVREKLRKLNPFDRNRDDRLR